MNISESHVISGFIINCHWHMLGRFLFLSTTQYLYIKAKDIVFMTLFRILRLFSIFAQSFKMKNLLANQRRLFGLASFTFKESESKWIHLYFWISMFSETLVIVPRVWFIIENISDIPLVAEALCTLLVVFVTIPKNLVLQYHRANLYDLFKRLEQLGRISNFHYRIF